MMERHKNAVIWIQQHINLGSQITKFYKQLCNETLINPIIYTYQQVFYWVHKFLRKLYATDVSNQVKSAMNFLEQKELVDEKYKVVQYQENDFVHSLGFTTFFYHLKGSINEVIINSTFKTNQEQFELFIINVNCGGYGVPLAYLYVDMYMAPEE
ncbi:20999_t:CDS:2 [Gigaspora margarita]|uniref:20999_t:CDS:1 n=1 Tax=Gigaspora margarita TaxID=4874 RepID=A0ABN7V999_GIGMA|nr:20999_t:CDS:2 [Gigaspora margarita]